MRAIVIAVLLGMTLVLGAPGQAQAPYYAGKTIEIIVPTAVGGPSDILNRSLAPFLEKHITGNPAVRIRNMPGGGTVLGSNWFAANAKPDGLTLLASPVGSKIAYVIQNPAVRYDFRKFKLVAISGGAAVFYASPRTGMRQATDIAKTSGLVMGSPSRPGNVLTALLAFEALGANPRVVFGFDGVGPIRLAFERGELNFDFQATIVYVSQVLPLVREGKVVPLMTLGYINVRRDVRGVGRTVAQSAARQPHPVRASGGGAGRRASGLRVHRADAGCRDDDRRRAEPAGGESRRATFRPAQHSLAQGAGRR